MTISNQELKHLIGQVEAAAAAHQHTAGRIERVAAGGTPPVLFSTDSTTAYAFAPSIETSAYVHSLVPIVNDTMRNDLALISLPGPAQLQHMWAEAWKVPQYRGLGRLFKSRPEEGERVIAWARSLNTDGILGLCAAINTGLGLGSEGLAVGDLSTATPNSPTEGNDASAGAGAGSETGAGPGSGYGERAYSPTLPLARITADLQARTGRAVQWVKGASLGEHRQAVDMVHAARAAEETLRGQVGIEGNKLCERQAFGEFSTTPVRVLESITSSRVRLGALEGLSLPDIAGAQPADLMRLDGVGEKTANQAIAAARAYWQDLVAEQTPRIDYTDKQPCTGYVVAVAKLLAYRDELGALPEVPETAIPAVGADVPVALASETEFNFLKVTDVPFVPAIRNLTADEAWNMYAVRAADFHALADDRDSFTGDLPDEIVQRIADVQLRGTVHASLRGYQAFGTKFAIAQKKVLIGDEMGLGKTMQALAAMVHVADECAAGEEIDDGGKDGQAGDNGVGKLCHALVVCPPSLRLNWQREVEKFTDFETFVIHGAEKDALYEAWVARGGVAIVGYPEVRKNPKFISPDEDVEILVVDEAHRVKNEVSQQSRAVKVMTEIAGNVIYLTGTPLENKVAEFQTLIKYLAPDIDTNTQRVSEFKQRIAPVYLRRNQSQVLAELPELVEVEDWVEPDEAEHARYRDAVERSHFMDMRCAYAQRGSQKMERLAEIVADAVDDGGKTIVFTYFRSVLEGVITRLDGTPGVAIFGPVAGGVSPEERQKLIDEFTAAPAGAVLVCQVIAAGEGLNIQAANRIVFMEPQLNPAKEAQAIARAHRMGQIRTVEVHRLLTPDAVDEQLMKRLAAKRELFNQYARDSVTADNAPEAVDVSEQQLIDDVIAAERARLVPTQTLIPENTRPSANTGTEPESSSAEKKADTK